MEDQRSKIRDNWERTRLQTYLLFNSQRTRKSFIEWPKFKKDIFPLETDRESGKIVTEEQIQNTWTADRWKDFLNGNSGTTSSENLK